MAIAVKKMISFPPDLAQRAEETANLEGETLGNSGTFLNSLTYHSILFCCLNI